MEEKFKVNSDFIWRFNNITVGTIVKGTTITVLQKHENEIFLSNGIGWVGNNNRIWKRLDIV